MWIGGSVASTAQAQQLPSPGTAPAPSQASQPPAGRADENAVRQAQDAFGTTVTRFLSPSRGFKIQVPLSTAPPGQRGD